MKKFMKKVALGMICAMFAFSLVACGDAKVNVSEASEGTYTELYKTYSVSSATATDIANDETKSVDEKNAFLGVSSVISTNYGIFMEVNRAIQAYDYNPSLAETNGITLNDSVYRITSDSEIITLKYEKDKFEIKVFEINTNKQSLLLNIYTNSSKTQLKLNIYTHNDDLGELDHVMNIETQTTKSMLYCQVYDFTLNKTYRMKASFSNYVHGIDATINSASLLIHDEISVPESIFKTKIDDATFTQSVAPKDIVYTYTANPSE